MKDQICQIATRAKHSPHLEQINEEIEPENGKVIHIVVERKSPVVSPFARVFTNTSQDQINPFSSIFNSDFKERVPPTYLTAPITFSAPSNSKNQNASINEFNGKETKKKSMPFLCGIFRTDEWTYWPFCEKTP